MVHTGGTVGYLTGSTCTLAWTVFCCLFSVTVYVLVVEEPAKPCSFVTTFGRAATLPVEEPSSSFPTNEGLALEWHWIQRGPTTPG